MHTVLATNPHTLPQHALQTLHTYTSTHTYAITRGERRAVVFLCVTGFYEKPHAHNSWGVVCIHIQSTKHLESIVVLPHHQAQARHQGQG
jgi:hypothetical protein